MVYVPNRFSSFIVSYVSNGHETRLKDILFEVDFVIFKGRAGGLSSLEPISVTPYMDYLCELHTMKYQLLDLLVDIFQAEFNSKS